MAKEARYLRQWIEVAPALLISPQKPSSVSKLETISEEGAETEDESPSPSMANQRLWMVMRLARDGIKCRPLVS